MTTFENIALGLATAAIGSMLTLTWNRVLYPARIEFFVEKTKLADEYKGILKFDDQLTEEISLRVKKFGYGVKGQLRFTEGTNVGQEYAINGHYSQGFLAFTYAAKSADSTSQGSATFLRVQDGNALKGAFVYNRQKKDKLSTIKCTLKRA